MLTNAANGQRNRGVEGGDAQHRSIRLANDDSERAIARGGDVALKPSVQYGSVTAAHLNLDRTGSMCMISSISLRIDCPLTHVLAAPSTMFNADV